MIPVASVGDGATRADRPRTDLPLPHGTPGTTMAKEETPDQMAARTFWVTSIGVAMFILISFAYATFRSFGGQ